VHVLRVGQSFAPKAHRLNSKMRSSSFDLLSNIRMSSRPRMHGSPIRDTFRSSIDVPPCHRSGPRSRIGRRICNCNQRECARDRLLRFHACMHFLSTLAQRGPRVDGTVLLLPPLIRFIIPLWHAPSIICRHDRQRRGGRSNVLASLFYHRYMHAWLVHLHHVYEHFFFTLEFFFLVCRHRKDNMILVCYQIKILYTYYSYQRDL
jgi:hypothetical protein